MYFFLFQSMAYNLYEVPLFIAMGAIGKNILFLHIQMWRKVFLPLHLKETLLYLWDFNVFVLYHKGLKSVIHSAICKENSTSEKELPKKIKQIFIARNGQGKGYE